jgi:uncharacterized protein (DUF1330 family)
MTPKSLEGDENLMNRYFTLGLTAIVSASLGAAAVQTLKAQAKPPAYVVIDIADTTDAEGFKAVTSSPATSPARLAALGGRYVIRTEQATALDGSPSRRFVLLSFDNKEKAQAWYDAPDIKEINAIRSKTTKSRAFIVEGLAN